MNYDKLLRLAIESSERCEAASDATEAAKANIQGAGTEAAVHHLFAMVDLLRELAMENRKLLIAIVEHLAPVDIPHLTLVEPDESD